MSYLSITAFDSSNNDRKSDPIDAGLRITSSDRGKTSVIFCEYERSITHAEARRFDVHGHVQRLQVIGAYRMNLWGDVNWGKVNGRMFQPPNTVINKSSEKPRETME